MVRWIRARLSYANVTSTLALFLALGTGTAYAANEWTGENIVDQSLTAADLQIGTIGTLRVQDNSLQAIDLATDSVGASEIATDAVGPTEVANNSIDGGEIVDNSLLAADLAGSSVGSSEIATGAVGAAEIVAGAVGASEIASNSVTSADLAGGASTGAINITAGSIPNGRCADVDTAIPGAVTGDAVIFSINGAAPAGVLFYGARVPSNGHVTLKVCNFTGGAMPGITNLPVSVITITI
jgi:hypothetical protein